MTRLERAALVLVAALLPTSSACSAGAPSGTQTAVLAGGCYWGMEGVFEHVKGVRDVVSGFAGGTLSLDQKSGERTGFAEAVRITFDPSQISYNQLLEIYATVAHDPTEVDRQGPDIGERYRSAIFPQNGQQREAAKQFLAQLRASGRYPRPIATRIESGGFDIAEPDQQDFMRKHPRAQYVVVNDLPKLAELKRRYPQLWRN